MSVASDPVGGGDLLALYDRALPDVYGYLVQRVGDPGTAEDLTSETFMAAVDGLRQGTIPDLTVAWLIGVARHKLIDHWRRTAREDRRLRAVAAQPALDDDPWEITLVVGHARAVLASLGEHHRSALALRYLDGLSVPEVAAVLERTVHATETLLVRARSAFRCEYEAREEGNGDDHG